MVMGLATGTLISYHLSSYMFGGLTSWTSRWGQSGEGDVDVMVTVDALKTTNKELKKQYGKINLDKRTFPLILEPPESLRSAMVERGFLLTDMTGGGLVEQLQDEMADLMDVCYIA